MTRRSSISAIKTEKIEEKIEEAKVAKEEEKKQEKEEKREGYYQSERRYGHFYRSIPLPEGAQLDKASAEFTNGVLKVSIPIPKAEHKRREVPVHEGGKTKSARG